MSAFIDHQNITTYFETGPGYMKYPGVDYSGHHSHEEYDWRKDPAVNKDIEIDPKGTHRTAHPTPLDLYHADQSTYVQPFEGRDDHWSQPLTTETNYLYSNTLVLKPENAPCGHITTWRRMPYWKPVSQVCHYSRRNKTSPTSTTTRARTTTTSARTSAPSTSARTAPSTRT